MNEVGFLKSREGDWQRLTHLCDAAEVSPSKLKPDEFHEFIRLYRRVSSDLATVRTRSNNIQLIHFLNDVVARAYGILYRNPKRSLGQGLWQGLQASAQAVRRCRWFVLLSAAVFFGSSLLAYVLLDVRPETRAVFVPAGMDSNFDAWKKGQFPDRTASESAQATGFYMFNNPRQSVIAGSVAAATFGVGTAGILYVNGAMLGALAHEVRPYGQMPHLFFSISPHGVTEISGIVISGGAGFVMAWALINPGRRRRGDALRAAGRDALILLITGTLMMFIAAPVEGFFSFNPLVPAWAKVAFACGSAAAWGLFWGLFGRSGESSAD